MSTRTFRCVFMQKVYFPYLNFDINSLTLQRILTHKSLPMKGTILFAIACLAMLSCNIDKKPSTTEEGPKMLVLYYSQTGATRTVANELQAQLGADIEEIVPVQPYDSDFQATIQRCQQEKAEGKLPEIKPIEADLSKYDVIFLGYPVWFGTYAPPVETFIKNADLSGKTIVTFCTFGSGGLNTSTANLKAAQPDANVVEGYGVRNARMEAVPAEVENFLKLNQYIEGEGFAPEYSEAAELTDADRAIYDAACGDYPMLHAVPTLVSKASTDSKNYYMFVAEENGQNIHVRVQVGTEEGAIPEFTEVVR
mgnify:FL=1